MRYRLHRSVWLPEPVSEVFPFFADATNLEYLTPPWLNFRILTPLPIELGKGVQIDYILRLHGFRLKWKSEIREWQPNHSFVDVQRRGPFRFWEHRHIFSEERGGTRVWDRIDYGVPGGLIVNSLLVRPDLNRIFDYRERRLLKFFGRRRIESPGAEKVA